MEKCTATVRSTGLRCKNWPINGGTVCHFHGGTLPRYKAKCDLRHLVNTWGLGDTTEDPGVVILRLLTQSYRRCVKYAGLLQQVYEHAELVGEDSEIPKLPGGVQALIGGVYACTPDGEFYKTSEQIRGLVQLEERERKLCADIATKAIAAGLAERAVRIAERQSQVIVEAVTAALNAAGVTGEARVAAQNAAADMLELTA